ncbi:hypothetical protein PF005_g13145 [Phytophthora fragariae]|uniref:Uncharacterized protein n=2 Tax=Phytophthora fragariae TaxID=53985 RepID=A0A6A3XPD4_9STRA|nr:hypothetical protein PF005_g13145 [Phytophthora fragariae]
MVLMYIEAARLSLQFATMPTRLELLRAERQEQAIEEAHPPVRSVDGARSVIADEQPAPNVNIPFEMCVLRVEEFDRYWRLDLIDRDDEPDFEKILGEFELLDVSRRNKFVFQLTIWKSRNDALNQLEYRQGFSYRFNRVHSLKLMYGNPLGSMHIRHRLGAEPLVSAQTPANSHGQLRTPPQAAVVSREEHLHHDSATAAPVNVSAASPELPAHAGEGHTPPQSSRDEETYVVTLAEKPLTKRRSRADEEIEVPPKQRKQSRKALCFESPPRPTVCR